MARDCLWPVFLNCPLILVLLISHWSSACPVGLSAGFRWTYTTTNAQVGKLLCLS
ncbi:hypothetical protein CGRA01v4_02578 [Colletotrichum graminicola]|nr:hypothetical protein CGRA01v4_02578 [Colletotrichum graminicola]